MSLGTTTPTWDPNNGFGVFSGGAVVSYDPIVNSSGIEIPNSYIVQWSLNSSFSSVAGSQCFPATGAQQPWIVSGISGTGPYYFRAAGVLGSCVSGTVGTYSAATSSAYTITNPSSGYLIQGAVTWAGTATGPLYVGFYDMSTGKIYATVAGSKASPPTSPTSYSVYVPAGNNYFNFGIVDQNNNGLMVPGSIGNTNEQANTVIAISSATNLGTLALPTNTAGTAPLNSMAVVRTQSTKQTNSTGSTNYWYGVNLRVNGLYKLPESVQLFSGPSYLTVTPPVDISTGAFTGNTDEWDYYPSTNGATPSTNDVFTFNVGYTDGTSNSTANTTPNPITVSPTAVISAWATNMLPAYNTSSVSTTPTFAWNYPSSPSSYTYKFQLQDSSYKTIWSIPADNSHSNGFSSTVTPSITWGTDPTGGSSTPSVSSLDSNSTYTWSITAYDSNSNQATTQMAFTTPEASLTLPSSATGTALVNSPFSETLNASGGTGSGYVFTVAVNSGSAQTVTSSALLLTDGIYVSSNGSSLTFSGTPTTVETITLAVSVTDSSTNSAGPVTYYINVVNGPDGTHNGKLNGRYVCKTDGYIDSDGARLSSLSSIVANGSGILSDGVFNANSRDLYSTTGAKYGTMTGSYSIGSDNNGILTTAGVITSTGGGTSTRTWAIALTNATSPASQFRMVETDDVGASASGQHGTANCYLATTSAFDVSTFSGNGFAFGMQGENGNGIPKAYVGRMTASTGNSTTGGTISSGIMDGMRVDQTTDKGGTFATTSTYSAPDAYGRVTLTIIPTGQTTGQTFVVYIIDADRMFLLQTAGDSGLMAGEMRTQQTSSFTWTNTVGNSSVLYGQGYEYSSGSVSGYDSSIMQASGASTGTYTGTLTVNASYDDSNGTYTAGKENGYPVAITLDSSNPGRATFSPGSDSAFLYFFKNGNAFFLDLSSGYLETGWLEAQSTTITTGAYMMSRLAPIEASGNGNVGEMTVTSGGSITGASSSAGEGNFSWDQSFSTTYTTDSATYGTFLVGSGSDESSCAVISSTKIVCLDNTSDHADMTILQK
jgi:hypothetical protein